MLKDSIILNNFLIFHFCLKTKWFPFEPTLTQFSASLLNCTSVCILEHFEVYIVCISILWPCAISSSKWALVIMTWCWIFMYVVSSSMSYSFILINNSTLVWLEGPLKASLSTIPYIFPLEMKVRHAYNFELLHTQNIQER